MKRIVHVIGRNGKEYNVPMTAEQAAFYLRLAEFKAINDDKRKSSRRNDLVLDRKEKADIKTAISTASASCARYIANIKTEVRKTNFNFGMF